MAESTEILESKKLALTCGIIMPIAAIGVDYPESHWKDVKDILSEAIELAGLFLGLLVILKIQLSFTNL